MSNLESAPPYALDRKKESGAVAIGTRPKPLRRRPQLISGCADKREKAVTEDEIKVICGALDLTNKTARK